MGPIVKSNHVESVFISMENRDVMQHVLSWLTYWLIRPLEMLWLYLVCNNHIVGIVIRTLHDCPSQMNENLLISNSKLTSDSQLIWWR